MNTEPLLLNLPIDSIQASATNPRQHFDRAGLDELMASIGQLGIQVPLLVRKAVDSDGDPIRDTYELVSGERRLRAARALGLVEVPCYPYAGEGEESHAEESCREEARRAQALAGREEEDRREHEEALGRQPQESGCEVSAPLRLSRQSTDFLQRIAEMAREEYAAGCPEDADPNEWWKREGELEIYAQALEELVDRRRALTAAQVSVTVIPEADGLDAIRVMWEDFAPGKGQVTIICWGSAWTAYFGGMGAQTTRTFFATSSRGYMVDKMSSTQWLKVSKRHIAYLSRLVEAIRAHILAEDAELSLVTSEAARG